VDGLRIYNDDLMVYWLICEKKSNAIPGFEPFLSIAAIAVVLLFSANKRRTR